MGKKRRKVYLVLGNMRNMRQSMAIRIVLPGTAYSNPVISEVGIKKGLARLIYIIIYSKIGGQRCFF